MESATIIQKAPTPESRPPREFPYYVMDKPASDLVDRFLEAFAWVLEYTDYKPLLDTYCRSTAKCNRCAVACPVLLASGDPRDIPCYRTNILLDIYRRYFTMDGWAKSRFTTPFELTEEVIDEMGEVFYRCTACRRCTRSCPLGFDHGLITRLGRYLLSLVGIAPKALQVSVEEQLHGETHNTSKVPQKGLLDILDFLSEEMEENLGVKLEIPTDKKDRDYVFFCAVSDYLMEPDTLMGNAAVLYAAGDWDRWTIGLSNYDGINYGLFYSDWHLENIIKQLVAEVERLRGRNILIGECGHASRSAHDFIPTFMGDRAPPVFNFMEYTLDCLEKGKITLDPNIITEKVAYHDPCNIARSGWIVEQPRKIIRSFIPDFVDMAPKGQDALCCGGGGGLVSIDEMHEFRMEVAGKLKAEQIARSKAEILIAPCANCKKQLKELVEYYDIPCKVMGLHDAILQAIEIPGGKSPAERKEEAALFAM